MRIQRHDDQPAPTQEQPLSEVPDLRKEKPAAESLRYEDCQGNNGCIAGRVNAKWLRCTFQSDQETGKQDCGRKAHNVCVNARNDKRARWHCTQCRPLGLAGAPKDADADQPDDDDQGGRPRRKRQQKVQNPTDTDTISIAKQGREATISNKAGARTRMGKRKAAEYMDSESELDDEPQKRRKARAKAVPVQERRLQDRAFAKGPMVGFGADGGIKNLRR